VMGSARISTSLASSASISARVDIVQLSVPGSTGPSVGASCGLPVLPGTTSSAGGERVQAVVTKVSRTAEKALYSSPGYAGGVQDRHEGSGAQQRDGELQSSTESPPEGIADLHRVTLAVRVICQVRGPTTPSGVGPFSRWKATPTHVIAGQTVDPVNPRPSRHDTPSGLATASRRYHRPPAPRRRPRPGQAQRGDRRHRRQPVAAGQVAIKPGGTVTFRIAGGQTHPVGSGQAPPGDRRFDASKCQPRTSPRSGTLAR
jgi:hypothetical protein